MKIDAKLIGKRVKEIRKMRKMSQMLLAEKSEISDAYLSYIECGKKKPSLDVIIKIAESLNTSVDSLLEGHQNISTGSYEKELSGIMEDCSPFEKRVLYEMIGYMKSTIRQNRTLFINEVRKSLEEL